MTVRFASGWQHLNGERAIEYARARETIDNIDEGSDFARSRRQRLIMEAFKTRLFQPGGLVHLPQILAIASQHIDTNYSAPDAAQLSRLILDWKDVTIYQTALTAQNYLEVATGPDGAYILVPSSTDHSWAQIAAFTRRLWQDPATGVAMAGTTVIVENDTGVAGVAGKVSTALEKLGYQVGDPTTGPVQPRSQLVDRTANGAGAVLGKSLQSDLGISFDVSAEPAVNGPSAVVLHLGSADADLAPSVPPSDQPAPFSVAGVEYFGDWPAPQPTPDPRTIRPTARRLPTGTVAPDALSALGTPPASETALLGTASPVATPGTPSPGLTPGTASPVVSPNATPVPPTSPIATGSALTTVPTVAPNASTTPPARLTATPPRQPSASATPSRKPRRSPTAGLGAVATPIP
jgi:hypothetical protein